MLILKKRKTVNFLAQSWRRLGNCSSGVPNIAAVRESKDVWWAVVLRDSYNTKHINIYHKNKKTIWQSLNKLEKISLN